MTTDFAGRQGAAIVLGASGGLGAAVAGMLLGRGSDVALTFRRESPRIRDLLGSPEGTTRAYRLDLADPEACARVVDAAAADFGGLHTLVYAAGPHVPMVHLSRVTPERFRGSTRSTWPGGACG